MGGIRDGRVDGKLAAFCRFGGFWSSVDSEPVCGESEWRFARANLCCANAHCEVDLFGVRTGGLDGSECCVLRAGGGPDRVSIPLLLCDAGGLRPFLASWNFGALLGG